MSNVELTKEKKLCSHGHASRRKCDTCDYEDVCNDAAELTDQIIKLQEEREELRRDVARWVNAHRVVMIERDSFKLAAEVNKATVETQAEEIRKLSATVDGFLGPKFAQEAAYYRSKS